MPKCCISLTDCQSSNIAAHGHDPEKKRLAGRSRYILKGDSALVPKHAVVLER